MACNKKSTGLILPPTIFPSLALCSLDKANTLTMSSPGNKKKKKEKSRERVVQNKPKVKAKKEATEKAIILPQAENCSDCTGVDNLCDINDGFCKKQLCAAMLASIETAKKEEDGRRLPEHTDNGVASANSTASPEGTKPCDQQEKKEKMTEADCRGDRTRKIEKESTKGSKKENPVEKNDKEAALVTVCEKTEATALLEDNFLRRQREPNDSISSSRLGSATTTLGAEISERKEELESKQRGLDVATKCAEAAEQRNAEPKSIAEKAKSALAPRKTSTEELKDKKELELDTPQAIKELIVSLDEQTQAIKGLIVSLDELCPEGSGELVMRAELIMRTALHEESQEEDKQNLEVSLFRGVSQKMARDGSKSSLPPIVSDRDGVEGDSPAGNHEFPTRSDHASPSAAGCKSVGNDVNSPPTVPDSGYSPVKPAEVKGVDQEGSISGHHPISLIVDTADIKAAMNLFISLASSKVDQPHDQRKRKVKRAERVLSPIVAPSASVMDAFCAIVFDNSDGSLSVEGHEVSFRWKLCVEM